MRAATHFTCMTPKREPNDGHELAQTSTLPYGATLGSSIRAKGILQELRAQLPAVIKDRLA
jgi:hypothetical protein